MGTAIKFKKLRRHNDVILRHWVNQIIPRGWKWLANYSVKFNRGLRSQEAKQSMVWIRVRWPWKTLMTREAYSTLRNETKRNETVLCETVLCEMVLCETVLCETVTTQWLITPHLEYLEFHWKLKICKDKPGANLSLFAKSSMYYQTPSWI